MKNATYKKKNQLLLIASAVFLLICYWLAFKSTFVLYSEVNQLEQQALLSKEVDQKLSVMQNKLRELDALPGLKQSTDTSMQQKLLGIVTSYCQRSGVLLREFPKTISFEEGEYVLEMNVFVAEGNFSKLLELVYLIEQKSRVGKVASVGMEEVRQCEPDARGFLADQITAARWHDAAASSTKAPRGFRKSPRQASGRGLSRKRSCH